MCRICNTGINTLLNNALISARSVTTMKKRLPPEIAGLKKKISLTEIIILLLLIIVWGSMFWAMNAKKEKYVHTMVAFQEQVLTLAGQQVESGQVLTGENWPFRDIFRYFVVRDSRIISSNLPWINGGSLSLKEAFGGYINAEEVIPRIRMGTNGTNWIRRDKVSARLWMSWSAFEDGSVFGIVSDEEALLGLTGFPDFKAMLLVCAVLASALLLLGLIWALSWMRLSAVKGLSPGRR
jgi:hypothetical protein